MEQSGNQRPILLVEDNPNDELLTLRGLKKSNLTNEIVVARDGAEAIDYLFGAGQYSGRDVQKMPVVVLLDLKLPKLDGIDVLRRIRGDERLRFLPVVILTSSRADRDMVDSYQLGANAYVTKPVEYADFIQSIGQLGLFWAVVNQPL